MTTIPCIFLLAMCMMHSISCAFTIPPPSFVLKLQQPASVPQSEHHSTNHAVRSLQMSKNDFEGAVNRRTWMTNIVSSLSIGMIVNEVMIRPAHAIPLVTVAEFETILKSSAKSVQIVELSGPKSETAVVTLIDGTQFGISDLYESPTDPRSPLKLIATCRSYNIPTKSIGLEQAVMSLSSSGSKKKKVYMNKRVQEAAEKEREKKERMEQDELERQRELERMKASENVNE